MLIVSNRLGSEVFNIKQVHGVHINPNKTYVIPEVERLAKVVYSQRSQNFLYSEIYHTWTSVRHGFCTSVDLNIASFRLSLNIRS